MSIGREVPGDQIPASNNIDAIQKAHERVWDNPGKWFAVAGPFTSAVARVYASQANAGTRWKSLVRPADTHTMYKGWTDPDAEGEKRGFVLAMAQPEEE